MIASFLLLGLAAASPDYPTRDVGDWKVAAARDGDGCFMTRTYARPGETVLLLGLSADGTNRLSLLNANWSVKPQDRLTLDYRLSNRRFPRQLAIGLAADRKRGFVATFDARFPALFAAATDLAVDRGDVPVERLTLEGSGAAMTELRRCIAAVRGAPGAQRGTGPAIPIDPFAESKPKRRP